MTFDPTGTDQALLVTSALTIAQHDTLLASVVAALSTTGFPAQQLALLPVAGTELLLRFGSDGGAVLSQILYGDWQTLLRLPDALAQSVALTEASRVLLAEAVLDEAATVVAAEAQRLTALAQTSTTIPAE